jgi:hypothetical protein
MFLTAAHIPAEAIHFFPVRHSFSCGEDASSPPMPLAFQRSIKLDDGAGSQIRILTLKILIGQRLQILLYSQGSDYESKLVLGVLVGYVKF